MRAAEGNFAAFSSIRGPPAGGKAGGGAPGPGRGLEPEQIKAHQGSRLKPQGPHQCLVSLLFQEVGWLGDLRSEKLKDEEALRGLAALCDQKCNTASGRFP